MFRDGKIELAGAAVLAELPVEDQKDFFKQYGEREKTPDYSVFDFVKKKQRFAIRECMEKTCKGCGKRTHNEGNELFEEAEHLNDVCLDGGCYRLKWYEIISKALAKKHAESEITDGKIYFRGGIPEMLYKEASIVRFKIGKAEVELDVLSDKDYEFSAGGNKKTGCCWQITENPVSGLFVDRVGYKKKQPVKKSGTGADGKADKYGKGVLKAVAADRGGTDVELAKELDKKTGSYDFGELVKEKIFERVVTERIEDEKNGVPLRNYFLSFLLRVEEVGGCYFTGKDFSPLQKKWRKDLLGGKTLEQIGLELSDEIQTLFHFLLLRTEIENDLPDIDNLKDKSRNVFFEYADINADEYRVLYNEAAREVVEEVLKSKEKKAPLKKKKAAKSKNSKAEVQEDEDDDYPFTPERDADTEEDEQETEEDSF